MSYEILRGKKIKFLLSPSIKSSFYDRSITAHNDKKTSIFSIWSRPHSGKERYHQLGVGRVVTCNHVVYAGRNYPSKISKFWKKKNSKLFFGEKVKKFVGDIFEEKAVEMLELNEVEKKTFSF